MARARRRAFTAVVAAAVGALGLPVAVTPAVPLLATQAGCAGSDCDSDTATWGSCTQGERLDANTWESGRVTGQSWLDFHGERTWLLDPTPWMGTRQPTTFEVDLALDPLPNADGGGGFAPGTGNDAEVTLVQVAGGWKVQLLNDTCAQYYLRVVLHYEPADGGTTSTGACSADGGS